MKKPKQTPPPHRPINPPKTHRANNPSFKSHKPKHTHTHNKKKKHNTTHTNNHGVFTLEKSQINQLGNHHIQDDTYTWRSRLLNYDWTGREWNEMGVGMCETEGFVRNFAFGILLSSQERKPEASLSLSVCVCFARERLPFGILGNSFLKYFIK